MNTILSMERDSYFRDYQRILDAELREAEDRHGREIAQIKIGRGSIIKRALSILRMR